MTSIGPDEVIATFEQPGFEIAPPNLVHAERIPAEALEAMRFAWTQIWFPPRPLRICQLDGVFVAADGLVLRADASVVPETVQQHTQAQVDAAIAAIHAQASPRLEGTSVLCRKPGAQNYGHWIVELLPRAALCLAVVPRPVRVMVQAVDGALRQVMRDSLALLNVTANTTFEAAAAPVWVERLVLVDGLSDHGCYLSPLAIETLEAIVAGIPAAGPASLFLTRPGARRLSNEVAVAAAAAAGGFAVVDPGALSFHEQVALFKGARRIVGVMGAGLANIAFAPPDAEIFVLAPQAMPDTFFWFLAGLRRQRALEIRCRSAGPQTGARAWDTELELDTSDLARVLDATALPPVRAHPLLEADLDRRFDAPFYLAANPDVAAARLDPLRHYLETGWREGRAASPSFGPHAPVADMQINPLIHAIITHGQRKERP